ncbi:MAG: rhomboid family intrarane serine protease [Gammaproteobacteria bacterium]|jgi:membrane associated rhomboid family serine protease|nr:rhomboid family intrarane serine protease [Gammaproteobacteria bacterium]
MFRAIPPVTRAILIANVVVYLLELVTSGTLIDLFALWPLGTQFHPWQVVTYAFLHDPRTFLHILFNMFALYMFGGALERFWGSRRFAVFYFASVLAAAGTELLVLGESGVVEPVIGASGGVFGLLLGFAWFFPRQRLILLPIPIPMPAWLFVTVYGALELVLGVTGAQDSVAHFAHLGGMLGGAIMILLWRTRDSDRSALR